MCDDLVHEEKVGISTYYWSFPGELGAKKRGEAAAIRQQTALARPRSRRTPARPTPLSPPPNSRGSHSAPRSVVSRCRLHRHPPAPSRTLPHPPAPSRTLPPAPPHAGADASRGIAASRGGGRAFGSRRRRGCGRAVVERVAPSPTRRRASRVPSGPEEGVEAERATASIAALQAAPPLHLPSTSPPPPLHLRDQNHSLPVGGSTGPRLPTQTGARSQARRRARGAAARRPRRQPPAATALAAAAAAAAPPAASGSALRSGPHRPRAHQADKLAGVLDLRQRLSDLPHLKDAANRWTDNCFEVRKKFIEKFNMDAKEVDKHFEIQGLDYID